MFYDCPSSQVYFGLLTWGYLIVGQHCGSSEWNPDCDVVCHQDGPRSAVRSWFMDPNLPWSGLVPERWYLWFPCSVTIKSRHKDQLHQLPLIGLTHIPRSAQQCPRSRADASLSFHPPGAAGFLQSTHFAFFHHMQSETECPIHNSKRAPLSMALST